MDFQLSDEQRLLRDTVRDFARGEVAPVAAELDRTKAFPYELVAKMGELDLMGIPFPESVGGGGGDTLAYALAVEELTRIDSSVAITLCAHTSLGTQPVYLFGSDDQQKRLLPDLCAGRKLGAFGLTEPEAGSDAGNTQTRARLAGDEWIIDGAKQFITNAGTEISGHVAITAITGDNEISNLIVERGTPGYEAGEPYRKMGWNASDTRPLTFTDCRVPGGEPARPTRRRLQAVPAHPRHRPDRGRGDGCRARAGSARRGRLLREGAAGVRTAHLEVPGDPDEDRQHLGRARGGPPAHLSRRAPERTPARTSP